MLLVVAGALALVLAVVAGDRFGARAQARSQQGSQPYIQAYSSIDAGRYLVKVGGCNDCHTPGYMEADGQLPESEWLVGSPLGWRGPWGTTYPPNLRLFVQETPEDLFVQILHTRKVNPPMPWPSVNAMSEADVRSIHRFIKSLGPKGERRPRALGPGEEPEAPYLDMTPHNLPEGAMAAAPFSLPAR